MTINRQQILDLKKEVGINKKIPSIYEEPILTALSYYPELKHVRIHFKLTGAHPVPYGTTPAFASLFRAPKERTYYITLLEKAEGPEFSALFKNLGRELQVAVIAHELSHVLQFQALTAAGLLKAMVLYALPFYKKKLERDADIGAIEHEAGPGLYKLAVYLRSIPGYLQKRPAIDKYYLKPHEIMEHLNSIKNTRTAV